MTLPMDSFCIAMADAGLAMHKPSLNPDGRLHRYRVESDKAGSLNGWYVLHLESMPFGAFGSWKTGQSSTWTAGKPESMTYDERRALQKRLAVARAARDAEQLAVYAAALERAGRLWQRARLARNDHPYLLRKGVVAYGLRDTAGVLHSLQFITGDGRKTFLTGGRKRGCYHAIGRPDDALAVCEGYATGATVYAATGIATAVAFDAGNLLPVAKVLRRKFPELVMVICADNDTATPGNPGVTAATTAARAVGAALAVPTFPEVASV